MRIDAPTPEQLPQLRELWKTAFGDSDTFLDHFYTSAYSPGRCRCVSTGGEVAAALYWFDVSCREQKMAYIYAVATAPAHRGKGLCRTLMTDTHAYLRALGHQGTLLVPEGEALRRMYAGMGYGGQTNISEFICAAGGEPAPMHRIDAAEYAKRRRELLPAGSVVQEGENLAFLETMAEFYTGLGFLLCARREGDTLHVPELLGNTAAAPGILLALGAALGNFRAPGEGKAFAMFHPLTPGAIAPDYFGLAFD